MLITTSNSPMTQLVQCFDTATKGIKADALAFIAGKRTPVTARAFIGLSKNSKMPAYTFAIPARQACPRGDKLAEIAGTVCSGCYATKGHDAMQPAKDAKARRWAVADLAAKHSEIKGLWVEAYQIAMKKEKHFRWHSAGDLYSDEYTFLVATAIKATPHVSHWIPTRQANQAKVLHKLPNAVVRVSDDMVNQESNKWYGHTSGVHTKDHGGRGVQCSANKNGGSCGDCRACWSPSVAHVSYEIH
jgi:hypothetical protein